MENAWKRALKRMVEDDIYKYESRASRRFIRKLEGANMDVDKIPFPVLIHECDSVEILKDSILYMITDGQEPEEDPLV